MVKIDDELKPHCDGSNESALIAELRTELGYYHLAKSETETKDNAKWVP